MDKMIDAVRDVVIYVSELLHMQQEMTDLEEGFDLMFMAGVMAAVGVSAHATVVMAIL